MQNVRTISTLQKWMAKQDVGARLLMSSNPGIEDCVLMSRTKRTIQSTFVNPTFRTRHGGQLAVAEGLPIIPILSKRLSRVLKDRSLLLSRWVSSADHSFFCGLGRHTYLIWSFCHNWTGCHYVYTRKHLFKRKRHDSHCKPSPKSFYLTRLSEKTSRRRRGMAAPNAAR